MTDGRITLLDGVTADGSGDWTVWNGGVGQFTAWGTFGSGTVKLQYSPDDGVTAIDAGADAELTADGGCIFTLAPCKVRADLSGSTSADVSAAVNRAE